MKKALSIIMAGVLAASLTIGASAVYEAEKDLQKVAFEIKKARVEQKFDGKITDGEYYKVDLKDSWFSYAANKDTDIETAKNLKPELYMSWDENGVNVYTSYSISKDKYIQTQTAGNIWSESCIQVSAAAATDTGTTRLEYGIAKSSKDNAFIGNVWAQLIGTYTPTEGKNAFVDYIDGKLVYETKIPWENILKDTNVSEGSQFGFNMVWSSGTSASFIHTQLASGCTGDPGKKADNFAKVTLAAAPKVVEKPAAAETADVVSLTVAALAVSAAAAIIVAKRKH